ncbi:DUF6713 family protein [Falsiroseomonas sp. HC035]|uniref:DUF6713 family protein n=1 Tax=Falsiroseomonas sp. HC035 TaxID=3390999 RepID=UPI003D321ADC
MSLDLLYHALLAAFLAHELDAVKRHEWRVLPLTRFLPDRVGAQLFIWSHLPLILAVLHYGEADATRDGFRLGLAIFAVAHVGLHWGFRTHPAYEFNNPSSWGLILLTGILGVAYVLGAVA